MNWPSLSTVPSLSAVTKYDLAVVTSFVVFVSLVRYIRTRPPPTFPGPPSYPFIGHVLEFLPSAPFIKHATMALINWGIQYDTPAIHLRIPGSSMIFLNKAKDIEELLITRSRNYSDRPRVVMLNEMLHIGWALPFKPYDEDLKTHRRIFAQMNGTKEVLHPAQLGACRRLLRRILLVKRGGHHDVIRIMAGDAVLNATYGIIPQSSEEPYITRSSYLNDLVTQSTKRGYFMVDIFPWLKHIPWTPIQRMAAHAKQEFLDARFNPYEYVKEQMETNPSHISLASQFIERMEKAAAEGKGHKLSEDDLVSTMASFYLAAADTTYNTTLSTTLLLSVNPRVQRKAQEAIDAYFRTARLPTYDDWRKVPYVDAVMAEVHRYNPAAPMGIPHVAMEDDIYDGRVIYKGTMVIGNVFSLFRDREIFDDDVEEFRPERFLNPDGTINKKRENYIYNNVFGWGRRACPGAEIAREFTWLIAMHLLSAFDIKEPLDAEGKPHDPHHIFKKYGQGPLSKPPPYTVEITPRAKWEGDLENELADWEVDASKLQV